MTAAALKSRVRQKLRQAVAPIAAGLTNLGRRVTPVGYVDSVRQKFIRAGDGTADAVDRFLAIRVITIALIIPITWFAFFWNPLGLAGMLQWLAWGLLVAAVGIGPDAMLSRRVEERQHDLRVKLPDILDLLTISVEAGLGFEQALDRTISAVPGGLSDEFSRMLGEVRAGASRADAMRALDQRTNVPEVRSFVLAVLQADTFGVSIGRVLRAQAEEMRIKRRQLAQERAQKAPVKMLIPMVFCIFPALFVVVIGPAVINIKSTF
jgi:tight adherence protein C